MKKDINTREDAVTKDMVPAKQASSSSYHFPKLGMTVQADTFKEALSKVKKEIKRKK